MSGQRKRHTKIKIALSVAISIFVTFANYWVGNTSIPLPDEMKVLKGCDRFKKWNGTDADSIPNEVLLIDVAYDKQLVDYAVDSIPMGQYAITDRQKLLDFLTIAQQVDNYKYILLDVIFEKGIESPQDSALFHLIANMSRIVIPVHEDTPLQDSILYKKAANADYTVTWEETNFSRFQFIHDGVKSIPLRMYEDINGISISKWGFLYFSNEWLCRNGISLKLPIKITGFKEMKGKMQEYNVLKIGADLLSLDSISPVSGEIQDKIVVIGNFKDDLHDTYAGLQPGPIICLNAYYALNHGDHVIINGVLCFYVLMFILYIVLSMAYLCGFTLPSITEIIWLKIVLSVISLCGINILFWIIAFLAYVLPLDIVYNVWIPCAVFSLLDYITNIYSNYKKIKNEKTASIVSDVAVSTDSTGTEG